MRDFYVSGIYSLSRYYAYGNTSVNEKFYYNNLNNFSLQVSSGKSWKQYTLSSAGILCGECLCKHTYLSRKGRLGVVGIFFVSFHFFFFPSSIELPRPWKFDQELRMEKRNHPFRDKSLTLFFFSYCRVFCTCRVLVNHDRSVKGTLVICQKGPLFGICFELKYRTST